MLNPSHVILGIALAATAAGARADGIQKLDKVEVTGHYENAVGTSDAASAGYITPQLIDDRPLLRPGEVLEYVPGMIVTQHSGAGKANQYFLRGFNLDHGTDFATYVAGMPVNMRTHAHGQGYTDLSVGPDLDLALGAPGDAVIVGVWLAQRAPNLQPIGR